MTSLLSRTCSYSKASRRWGSVLNHHSSLSRDLAQHQRFLSSDEAVTKRKDRQSAPDPQQLQEKLLRQDFNNRRAAYRRQVKVLRKQYAAEIAEQRAKSQAERAAETERIQRRKLERQRRKNERSAANAIRQEEFRLTMEDRHKEHLERQQNLREAQAERYRKARQLVVDELEKVAPLWLTTPEEVEEAFGNSEVAQKLWTYPGGVLGEPNPSRDCHFWQHETHTWSMARTYPARREVLLEQLREKAYADANIDANYWTKERKDDRNSKVRKAKLRSLIQTAGRRALWRNQADNLRQVHASDDPDELPRPPPVPGNSFMKNEKAHEEEGLSELLKDPKKFFVFAGSQNGEDDSKQLNETEEYTGLTLGAPTGLRDPLRENSPDVFPRLVGGDVIPDTRTEKEKRQQEREERMLAAAHDIELAAEEQTPEDLEPDIDYNVNEWEQQRDAEWRQGLDPVTQQDVMDTPPERQYSEEDIDWAIGQLDAQIGHFEEQFKQDMEKLQDATASEIASTDGKGGTIESDMPDGLQEALLTLNHKQLMMLSDLDDDSVQTRPTQEELDAHAKQIGLTSEQLAYIVDRER